MPMLCSASSSMHFSAMFLHTSPTNHSLTFNKSLQQNIMSLVKLPYDSMDDDLPWNSLQLNTRRRNKLLEVLGLEGLVPDMQM